MRGVYQKHKGPETEVSRPTIPELSTLSPPFPESSTPLRALPGTPGRGRHRGTYYTYGTLSVMAMVSKIYHSKQYLHEAYDGWSKKNKPPKAKENPYRPIMVWRHQRFEVHQSYEIRGKLKSYGFQFDPERKCWFTPVIRKAVRAIRYANDEAKGMLTYFLTN